MPAPPETPSLESILWERWRAHAWTLRSSKRELRARRSKTPGRRKPGGSAPFKWLRLPQGQGSQRASPWVYPHILFLPASHFPCLTASCLCGSSFPHSRVHQGLATGHWSLRLEWLGCSTPMPQPNFHLCREPKPCFQAPQAEAPWDQYTLAFAKWLAWCWKHSISGSQIFFCHWCYVEEGLFHSLIF